MELIKEFPLLFLFTLFLLHANLGLGERSSYPPCRSFPCQDVQCCSNGKYKIEWPELLGKTPEEAKAVIGRDNPLVTVVLVPRGTGTTDDFCCNRVWLKLDDKNRIYQVPIVG
ncbi:UNVERIFIED_CONTAM: Subtilisin-chymotrypsin inhibitor-2A [Sesamum latifolium]|uniref:Subtilisin-chymotrypsin inhibitor-2A n=1 Tax=Sesamum latifolium TaxID=2727402 RepID=A0AAW2VS45_9LAMI